MKETTDLDLSDALRLAEIDERFGDALLESPEEFRRVFALKATEIRELKSVSAIEELAESLNSKSK